MKKEKKISSISTFLGSDSSIEGTIEFQGTIRLDGRAKGKISSNGGTLIVGEELRAQSLSWGRSAARSMPQSDLKCTLPAV
jgi:cytoskeletal protein CcmA (bactofilin family)